MRVEFHPVGSIEEAALAYAVIAAKSENKWILVRHRQRLTWEIPGGRKEVDELIAETAARELREETGAKTFRLSPVCEYAVVMVGSSPSYGRLFYAEVDELGNLPESEIGQVVLMDDLPDDLTHPLIQPHLFDRVRTWLRGDSN